MYSRMSRYVAKLIQQLKPNNLNYTKYKTRYNYFSEKYIIIPSAKGNYYKQIILIQHIYFVYILINFANLNF